MRRPREHGHGRLSIKNGILYRPKKAIILTGNLFCPCFPVIDSRTNVGYNMIRDLPRSAKRQGFENIYLTERGCSVAVKTDMRRFI